MSKKKDIVIDADHIAFMVAESNEYKSGVSPLEEEYDDLGLEEVSPKLDMKPYKAHFKRIIDEYVKHAEVESILYDWELGDVKVILSDTTNFRYEIFPEYKNKRPSDNHVRKKLRKWARKKYICEPNTEADDVVAYYVRKGAIGFTTDKDLLLGVEGIWFNSHYRHKTWNTTTKEDAEFFFKCQVLAGDGVDGIPSLPRVGLKTAEKLLNEKGSDWKSILNIFKDKGFDKDYMLTMARLVSMSQWSPKKGVKLWKIPK